MTRFLLPLLLSTMLAGGTACHRQATPTAAASTDCLDPSRANPTGICTMQYEPVCGCNGITYANACVAKNAGLRSFKPGPCPTRP
jgi:hypothetical protein